MTANTEHSDTGTSGVSFAEYFAKFQKVYGGTTYEETVARAKKAVDEQKKQQTAPAR